jgi:hypothetical protein
MRVVSFNGTALTEIQQDYNDNFGLNNAAILSNSLSGGGFDAFVGGRVNPQVGLVSRTFYPKAATDSGFQSQLDTLRSLAPQTMGTLIVSTFDYSQRQVVARVQEVTQLPANGFRAAPVQVTWTCPYPRWQSTTLKTGTLSASGTLSGTVVNNQGNDLAYPIVNVWVTGTATAVNPTLRYYAGTVLDSVRYAGTLTASSGTLQIDGLNQVMTLKGTVQTATKTFNHPNLLRFRMGEGTLQLVMSSGNVATVTVEYRDTFV